jgi:flagellar basal body rod protein FlgG
MEMPLRGILNTARSLSYYTKLQEVTANNIANANTDGFKADRLAAHQLPGEEHAVPVQRIDLEPGHLRDTGRPLDLAIEGPGFFVVQTDRGERWTRAGSLQLDGAGRLVDASGNPVLGVGGPLVLQGATVEVKGDGEVFVDDAYAGTLRVETTENPDALLKEGMGRFVPDATRRPVEPDALRLRQGAIEEPNVDPLLSMVDLITIQRAYQASMDALRALDGALGTVTNEVGRVQP